jgi:hypothetical protein
MYVAPPELNTHQYEIGFYKHSVPAGLLQEVDIDPRLAV